MWNEILGCRIMLWKIPWALIQSIIVTLFHAGVKSSGTSPMSTVVWWWASLAPHLRARKSHSKEPKNVWRQPRSACWRLLRTWLVYTVVSFNMSFVLQYLSCYTHSFFRRLKWRWSVWYLRSSTVPSWVLRAHVSSRSLEITMYRLSSQNGRILKVQTVIKSGL